MSMDVPSSLTVRAMAVAQLAALQRKQSDIGNGKHSFEKLRESVMEALSNLPEPPSEDIAALFCSPEVMHVASQLVNFVHDMMINLLHGSSIVMLQGDVDDPQVVEGFINYSSVVIIQELMSQVAEFR